MTIVRGTRDNKRQAKNYIHKAAQARLNETVPTFNQQVTNSLAVDSVHIDYYHVHDRVGQMCSCRGNVADIPVDISQDEVVLQDAQKTETGSSVKMKFQDTALFGDSGAERIYEDKGIDVSTALDFDPEIPDVMYEPLEKLGNVVEERNATGATKDCGICYRTGLQPGYVRHGTVRSILSSLNISGLSHVQVDKTETPHRFINHTKIGEVFFDLFVPKYFVVASYSVRLNKVLLKGENVYYNGHALTDDILRIVAGTTIRVSVRAREFTHVVMEFETGVEKIQGNLSPETKSLDYTMRDSVSNFTVVLPPTLHEVRNTDILVIRNRRLVLRVTEVERKVTADLKQLEWVVQTRVVQPQETIKNIHKSFKIG